VKQNKVGTFCAAYRFGIGTGRQQNGVCQQTVGTPRRAVHTGREATEGPKRWRLRLRDSVLLRCTARRLRCTLSRHQGSSASSATYHLRPHMQLL